MTTGDTGQDHGNSFYDRAAGLTVELIRARYDESYGFETKIVQAGLNSALDSLSLHLSLEERTRLGLTNHAVFEGRSWPQVELWLTEILFRQEYNTYRSIIPAQKDVCPGYLRPYLKQVLETGQADIYYDPGFDGGGEESSSTRAVQAHRAALDALRQILEGHDATG